MRGSALAGSLFLAAVLGRPPSLAAALEAALAAAVPGFGFLQVVGLGFAEGAAGLLAAEEGSLLASLAGGAMPWS